MIGGKVKTPLLSVDSLDTDQMVGIIIFNVVLVSK